MGRKMRMMGKEDVEERGGEGVLDGLSKKMGLGEEKNTARRK